MPQGRFIVIGSTSILGTYPDFPDGASLLEPTLEADFVLDPWDEALGRSLDAALGVDSSFFAEFGYHADLVRPTIFETFPPGFESRLIRLDPSYNAFALDVHDMAAAKVVAGRPKDVCFLAALVQMGKLDPLLVQERLSTMPMTEKLIVRSQATLERVVVQAGQES